MDTFKDIIGWFEELGLTKRATALIAVASLAMVAIARMVYGIEDSVNLFVGFAFLFGIAALGVVLLKSFRKKLDGKVS